MTEYDFIEVIYSGIKPGMEVRKPNKISKILEVTQDRKIYYLIGTKNKKAVTLEDLQEIYRNLVSGSLTNKKIVEISGDSRPCNTTTVKWILENFKLAYQAANGQWKPNWH
ncbi:hypothetical protein G9409_03100 [Chlorobium sp. BLA1]|uniref:hypothetical protein n=1 Tax=Candidatus Chlorobium masyuteum TaxID=2716876 RepID=UPI001423D567|nr:hypothetical protein [Candidatus Chlorobium masyuteum]NHQ59583.1 hypothetical protein [Candidatus Chlorobium masyuteum]NTU45448.1 hypothetical protein [Chlorobiaceae bacterium]